MFYGTLSVVDGRRLRQAVNAEDYDLGIYQTNVKMNS